MRKFAALVVVMMLLVPAAAVSQDPIQVCTEVVVPEELTNEPELLRAAPPDGRCDAVVYLPFALVDAQTYEQGLQTLGQAAADTAIALRMAPLSCEELDTIRRDSHSEDWSNADLEYLKRCQEPFEAMTCDQLNAAAADTLETALALGRAMDEYLKRCDGGS